jgi:uncharacterized protein (DUF849 family)
MIVQACLNGSRPSDFHDRLPLTAEALAHDGAACVAAGAAELHIHPRDPSGSESLAAVDVALPIVRRACPDIPVGVSTGAWIERDEAQTRNAIARWKALPDYASVNLSEPDAPAVMTLLLERGIGIEAGIASIADAKRLLHFPDHSRVLRILIEIEEQNLPDAMAIADRIAALLTRSGVQRPFLLHGFDATVWPLIALAHERRWSTRVGLEDGKHLPDGSIASDNATLVAAALTRPANFP